VATVLYIGAGLGGTVGIGTMVYVLGVGPILQLLLWATPDALLARSGWAEALQARRQRVAADAAGWAGGRFEECSQS